MSVDADLLQERGQSEGSQSQKLAEYWQAILERLWIVILCLVLGGIVGAIRVATQAPRFQARSVLFLEQEQNKVLSNVKDVREEQVGSLDMINTVVDLLGSYSFAERVVKRLGFKDAGTPSSNQEGLPSAGELPGMVTARYRKATRLIDIFVTHPDPKMAVTLANAYSDEYLRYVFERRSGASKNARQYLEEEAARLRGKMKISEEAMQSFRKREGAAAPEIQQTTIEARVQETNAQVSALEAKIFQLDADLKIARANSGKVDELLRLPSVSSDANVARLNAAIAEQQRAILLLSQRYRSEHPLYIANQTQLSSLINERNTSLQNIVSLLETERLHLQAQVDEIGKSRVDLEKDLLSVTGKLVESNDRRRELETDRAMYDSVLGRMKEIDMTTGFTSSPVNIQERAIGAAPLGDSTLKLYGTSIALGLAAGLGIALLLNALDSSIKTVQIAEEVTGLSVLSAVPKKTNLKEGKMGILDSLNDRQGIIAESFRSLRASIAMLAHAETKRTFLFTSALPSEGKTFTSANFAVTLAQQNLKTLLIDADLRKPSVSKVFFGKNQTPGLADVLSNLVSLSEGINATEIENLSILTAGNRAPNPAELLGTDRFKQMLDEALLTYDRVVIDTAPCLAVSDAQLIAAHADVRCLILRSMSTPKNTAARAVRVFEEMGHPLAGVVLNFIPSGNHYYYYSGRYYGSYGAKGVYGSQS